MTSCVHFKGVTIIIMPYQDEDVGLTWSLQHADQPVDSRIAYFKMMMWFFCRLNT